MQRGPVLPDSKATGGTSKRTDGDGDEKLTLCPTCESPGGKWPFHFWEGVLVPSELCSSISARGLALETAQESDRSKARGARVHELSVRKEGVHRPQQLETAPVPRGEGWGRGARELSAVVTQSRGGHGVGGLT